eukprot:TRINITY_DN77761_c0_g1_i1.p1 TRINITY_DN77761_c0_g1~~TRINITY_DN77761_c0_g1_i1.p1  ORF type:complete len:612 (-),score=140.77 TRINITY_DN77761_c0_g1_i1:21-1622(-)
MLPEHVEKFREALQGVQMKNHPIQIKESTPRKANSDAGEERAQGGRNAKRQKTKDFPPGYVPTLKDMKDKLKNRDAGDVLQKSAPLLSYSYETQLGMKGTYVKSAVRSITTQMEKKCKDMDLPPPSWTSFEWSKGCGAPIGCCCPLDEPIGTPTESLEGYRNKCEFSIAKNEAGDSEVGFVLRVTDEGYGRIVTSPDTVPIVPNVMKQLCNVVRDCVRASSLGVFERGKGWQRGAWRMLMARLSSSGEMLVMVQTATLGDDDKEALSKQLVDAIVAAQLKVVSIYLQFNNDPSDASKPGAPLFLIHGQEQLRMNLLGLKFDIGPLSFYQANNATCELLYGRALDWLRPDREVAMLDICCGVGTIGLCASQRCKTVVGVELIAEAVESAKANAALNGVQNTSWKVGRAEDVLPQVLSELDPSLEVCAVVDPPRPGLHWSVLRALRSCTQLSRIVYVSCNPESLVEDVVKLTLPQENDEYPFVPLRAVAVDMFPHTLHCEMILLLERTSKVEDPRKKAAASSDDQAGGAEAAAPA